MKFKKVILIPASVLCLGALFSCGKANSNSIFSGLQNGYESTEFEKYLKLPDNLFSVQEGYGQYVYTSAINNSVGLVRSTKTKNFEIGTSPFFANLPIFTPGTGGSWNDPLGGDSFGASMPTAFPNTKKTPFSSNVSKREAETIVNFYGSKGNNPVVQQFESSVRKDYDAYSNATITTQPTDNEYILYVDKDPTTEKNIPYILYKGKNPFSGMNNKPIEVPDVVFKRKMPTYSGDDPEAWLVDIAKQSLLLQVENVYKAESECATVDNLEFMGLLDTVNKDGDGGPSLVDAKFLSNGKDTLYIYNTILKGEYNFPVVDVNFPEVKTVKGYTTSDIVIKMIYDYDRNFWLCDSATSAYKVYVKANENLVEYNTPRCICSEYRHVDIGYKDLGAFGEIEKADLYESPNLMVSQTYTNLDKADPVARGDESINFTFDPYNDENMYTNGGIYDHTYSARKAGLIGGDEFLFYGETNFGTQSFFTSDENEYRSSHFYVQTELISSDGDTVVKVEPNESTIAEKQKDMLGIYEESDPKGIEVKGDDVPPFDPSSGIAIGVMENVLPVNVYIKLKKSGENYEVSEFTVDPSSHLSVH